MCGINKKKKFYQTNILNQKYIKHTSKQIEKYSHKQKYTHTKYIK